MTDFTAPSTVDPIQWKDLYGRLLAIWPYGRETTDTKFGADKACVRADIYDLDEGKPIGMDSLIFPRALVMQCSGTPRGKAVLGRLGQGESRNGQTPPWKLSDPTPEDIARASAYFSANPARIHAMSGRPATPAPQVSYSAPVTAPAPTQVTYAQPPAQPVYVAPPPQQSYPVPPQPQTRQQEPPF